MIKDALTELLEKEELRFISVRMLCELADLNRSTFYLHYETMDDLLAEYTEDLMKNVWTSDSINLSEKDYQKTLKYILDHQASYKALLKSGLYHRYILSEYGKIDFENNAALKNTDQEAFMLMSSYAVSGMEQMILYVLEHPEISVSAEELARVMYQMNAFSYKQIQVLSR